MYLKLSMFQKAMIITIVSFDICTDFDHLDKAVAEMIFDSLKEPKPSIRDIMHEDLTIPPTDNKNAKKSTRKCRTEDDLPGSKLIQTKNEKADSIADEILFYLVAESRNNFFPQRVIPSKLKLKTEQEIEKLEKEKLEKSMSEDAKNASEAKSVEELRETLENEQPNRMAINTDTESIQSYIKGLFKKVDKGEEEFVSNLSSALQRNPLEILMHLQNTLYELDSFEQLPYQPSVLTVDVYLDIERGRKRVEENELIEKQKILKEEHDKQKLKDGVTPSPIPSPRSDGDSSTSDDRSEFTRDQEMNIRLFNLKCEWENIHNKVIFDAVNEALDGLRPYGLKGPPLPWSKQNRTLTYRNGDVDNVPKIFEQVENKVMSWAKTYAGTLNFSELLKQYKIPFLDDDQLAQVREERLALLLATEIEENEPMWTDYEFEETQVKLDLANTILEDLVKETVDILKGSTEENSNNCKETPEAKTQEENNE